MSKTWFGKWGLMLYEKVRGRGSAALTLEYTPKSVGEQETFDQDTLDLPFIFERLWHMCRHVRRRFQAEGFAGFRTVVVDDRRLFAREMFETPELRDRLKALVRSYFDLGGMQLQWNLVDRQMLQAAQECPQDYRGLIVRVSGYSAHFTDLERVVQDDLITRMEHAV